MRTTLNCTSSVLFQGRPGAPGPKGEDGSKGQKGDSDGVSNSYAAVISFHLFQTYLVIQSVNGNS